ncbi:MAG TPA: ABA4-like family protein [Allosphingosinicella sp.]|nr:ABA4-like family protein [Allosphingosinicella sp.]
MIDPGLAFSLGNLLVLPLWLLLAMSLFVPRIRIAAISAARLVAPALLGVAYLLLIVTGLGEAQGGGFGSIAEVRALFASDTALAAGWLHYLAFDLFVGSWEAEDAAARGIPAVLVVPCLVLTLLFGPAGLLLYLLLRLAFRGRSFARETAS